jgi:hypothetical protein
MLLQNYEGKHNRGPTNSSERHYLRNDFGDAECKLVSAFSSNLLSQVSFRFSELLYSKTKIYMIKFRENCPLRSSILLFDRLSYEWLTTQSIPRPVAGYSEYEADRQARTGVADPTRVKFRKLA